MKVSVITICWNSARTLKRCVESVLAQSCLPSEYIFVDGGSNDGTLELIRQLTPALEAKGVSVKTIQQVRQPNEAGIPSAWNQGINATTGDLIALLNSDDCYYPNTLQTVVDTLEKHPEADIFAASIDLVDSAGNKTGEIHPKCLWLAQFLMPIAHPACFVRKRLYDSLGLYNTAYRISADYDFVWRCIRANAQFELSQDCIVRMETGGLANSNRAAARNETLAIARSHSKLPILPYLAWLARKITGR